MPETRGWSEKTNTAQNAEAEVRAHQRLSRTEAARGAHPSAPRRTALAPTATRDGHTSQLRK